MRLLLLIAATLSLLVGCSSIVPISLRDVGGGAGEYHVSGRKLENPEQPGDVYMKRSNVRIARKPAASRTGSLYQEGDAANYLASEAPLEAGRPVLVTVVAKGGEKAGGGAEGAPAPAAAGTPGATGDKGAGDLEAIIKNLPSLDAGSANPAVVKQFKMIVTRVLDNGDFEGVYQRMSKNDEEANTLEVKARIPRDAVLTKGSVTTAELADVTYFENKDAQIITRESSEWEDEYTLRMSGFSEARSQAAMELEDKRKQLDSVKKQLQTKLETMGAERRQVAKEREKVAKDKAENEQKMRDMTKELEDLKATVKEQEELLKKDEASLTDEPDTAKPAADSNTGK